MSHVRQQGGPCETKRGGSGETGSVTRTALSLRSKQALELKHIAQPKERLVRRTYLVLMQ